MSWAANEMESETCVNKGSSCRVLAEVLLLVCVCIIYIYICIELCTCRYVCIYIHRYVCSYLLLVSIICTMAHLLMRFAWEESRDLFHIVNSRAAGGVHATRDPMRKLTTGNLMEVQV